jgi:hypothetical protein
MSNLVLPAVGAIAGYAFFGPTGAQIGWMLGSAVQGSNQEIKQGTVADLRAQTSKYGTAIPYVLGRQRIAGNVIWTHDMQTYEKKTKVGKGGQTSISTGYTQSCLIGICKGPILGISRVWANGTCIIDARNGAKPLIGQLYTGTADQMPDPTYQSYMGADVPAYRGLAYISLTNFDLGSTAVLPNFEFEVVSGGTL